MDCITQLLVILLVILFVVLFLITFSDTLTSQINASVADIGAAISSVSSSDSTSEGFSAYDRRLVGDRRVAVGVKPMKRHLSKSANARLSFARRGDAGVKTNTFHNYGKMKRIMRNNRLTRAFARHITNSLDSAFNITTGRMPRDLYAYDVVNDKNILRKPPYEERPPKILQPIRT